MANLIKINPEPRFNENLYPNSSLSYTVVGAAGSTVAYNDFSANKDKSVKFTAVNTNTTTLSLGEEITIPYSGTHALSLYLWKFNPSLEWQFTIKIYKNSLLFETITADLTNTSSGFLDGKWNIYGQTFNFTAGEIVTFQIEASTATAGNTLYMSAPKFEFVNKGFALPSYYTYPSNFYSTSNDLYISETQWDVVDIGAQVIANGSDINLFTLINNALDKNTTNTDVFDELNIVSNSIITTYRNCKIIHTVRISLNILSGSDQYYQLQIRRSIDDSVVYRLPLHRNSDETIQTAEMTTRTLSEIDPFTIDGFYLAFVNNSGASATIDNEMSLVVISKYQKAQKQ